MSKINTGITFPNQRKFENPYKKSECSKMVNSTVDAINNLYKSDDENSKILKEVISLRRNVRIPTPNPLQIKNGDYVCDCQSTLWGDIATAGIKVIDKDLFLNKIKGSPERILDYPNDIFYVDSDTYSTLLPCTGVMLLSNSNIPEMPLTISWADVCKDGEPFSWATFLDKKVLNNLIPSNSLIVSDRYILSDFDEGRQNLLEILDCILPHTFNGVYHILLLTDESVIEYKKTKRKMSTEEAMDLIQHSVIEALERQYTIVFEALTVNKKWLGDYHGPHNYAKNAALDLYFKHMHNRKIISNYFVIEDLAGFNAVREDDNDELVSKGERRILFNGIYVGIDNKRQPKDKLPEKIGRDLIDGVRTYLSSDTRFCKFSKNGKILSVESMENRLIKV